MRFDPLLRPEVLDILPRQANSEEMLDRIKIICAAPKTDPFIALLSLIRTQQDMKLFDFDGDIGMELMMAVQELEPDVVVLPLLENDREPGICSHLLGEFADLVIVAVSPSRIHRLSKYCFLSLSGSALLETIRTATPNHRLGTIPIEGTY